MKADTAIHSDIDALAALNRDYIQSVQDGDVRRLDKILSDDFLCSNPDGSLVDKKQFLAQTAPPGRVFGEFTMLEIVLCAPDTTTTPSTAVDRIRSLDRERRLNYRQWLLVCECAPTVLVRFGNSMVLPDRRLVIDMCPGERQDMQAINP